MALKNHCLKTLSDLEKNAPWEAGMAGFA